jgi:hypothetical protein
MYNRPMHIFRQLGGALLAALLQSLLVVFPLVAALAMLLHSPQALQGRIKDSGLYTKVVPAIMDQSAKQAAADGEGDIQTALGDQGIQEAVQKAITPQTLEAASGQFINGIFGWLQGKTTEPQFTVDLTAPRQALMDNLNNYALDRAKALPACTLQQLRSLSPNQSVLEAPCLPPGVTPQTAADQFTQQGVNNTEFLKKTTLTNADLPKAADGQSVFANAAGVPQAYQWLMRAPWIIGFLMLATATAIIFVHEERWRGIRRVAICLLSTGLLFVILGLLQWLFFTKSKGLALGDNEMNPELRAALTQFVTKSAGALAQFIAIIGGAYAVLGVGGLITARKLRPQTEGEIPAAAQRIDGPMSESLVEKKEETKDKGTVKKM